MIALIAASAVTLVAVVSLALSSRWRRSAPRIGRMLRLAVLGVAILTSLVVLPFLVADRTGLAGIALVAGPPVLLTLIAAAASLLGRRAEAVVTWVITVLLFAYVIVYGLGVGLFYFPVALLMLGVALTRPRQQRVANI